MKIFTTLSIGLLLFISTLVYADNPLVLNNVTYQVSVQQWAKTKRARVIVSVNVTTSGQNIAKMRQSILNNLQKIAPGDWHITSFNRSQTSSGLETINAQAEIRLLGTQMTNLHQRVQSISKAGQTYRIQSMSFSPNLADMEATRNSLREQIYKQVRSEIKGLNAEYSNQRYFLHQIRFSGMMPMPRTMALMKSSTLGTTNLTVSQKVTMTATVTLSSVVGGQKTGD